MKTKRVDRSKLLHGEETKNTHSDNNNENDILVDDVQTVDNGEVYNHKHQEEIGKYKTEALTSKNGVCLTAYPFQRSLWPTNDQRHDTRAADTGITSVQMTRRAIRSLYLAVYG